MRDAEEATHAFILRIWIEHPEIKDAKPIWRGVIEAVEGDKRVYFNNLDKLRNYFAKYLENMGMKAENHQR